MFKAARWRSEKNKLKVVFRLQFQATQVPPLLGSETVTVSLVPSDVGRPSVKSEKVAVVNGTCNWLSPIYETVKIVHDPKTGKLNDKLYQFLVSVNGSYKLGLLGEVTLNLTDYIEAFNASRVSLNLKAGAILHVTIQRMQGEVADRQAQENEDATVRRKRQTLQSQLSKYDDEKGLKALIGRNGINFVRDGSRYNREPKVKFPPSKNLPTCADSNGKLHKSHSSDAVSAANSSDNSSEVYTPREKDGRKQKDSGNLFLPLTDVYIKTRSIIGSGEYCMGSTNSSEESGVREKLHFSDGNLEKLTSDAVQLARKVQVSELELHNLQKQIIKETKRSEDLSWEISILKEERDALRRECHELKLSKKRTSLDDNLPAVAAEPQLARKDPLSMVEEIKQELDHERNLNSSLRLQLEKTQEANSELLLAVRDLDDMLEERDREMLCKNCKRNDLNDEKTIFPECTKDEMEIEKAIAPNNDIGFYKKEHEELLMQMEQLALDYEILKQENHDITSRLEQMQLREQFMFHYECSEHLEIINDLEGNLECVEKQLRTQAESFESDIDTLVKDKVDQEKKAIQAEDATKKAKWNNVKTVDWLHEELSKLYSQVSVVLYENEKIIKQVRKEASELRSQKAHLENLLEESKENLVSVRAQFSKNLQLLVRLLVFKSKETEKLSSELKYKNEELDNYNKSEKERPKVATEIIESQQAEIEKLKMENHAVIEEKEKLMAKVESLKNIEEKENLITVLKSEVEALRLQYNNLKLSQSKIELEKEQPSSLISHSSGGLLKEMDGTTRTEQLEDIYKNDTEHCLRSSKHAGRDELQIDLDCLLCRVLQCSRSELKEINGQGQELITRCCRTNSEEKQKYFSCNCDQNKVAPVLNEMTTLRKQNESTEADLKEMQERYSEMSLKFAEVEGERQQLMITIRNLKNALKN